MSYKIYRQHYCERAHRTYRTWAKCVWRRAIWITGEGPYALLARCPRGLTVTLWRTPEAAEQAKDNIDRGGCGGQCWGASGHEIIEIRKAT